MTKFTDIKPETDLAEDELLLRLFGALELENRRGRLCENRSKPAALTWLTLKYLLVNSKRDVETEELLALDESGKESRNSDGAMRTRLRRVRDLLLPLGLESRRGLVLYSNGKYSVNSDWSLISDEDAFNAIMLRLRRLPADAEEGMELCAEALEIMRGPYLGYSGDVKWLRGYREHYKREFARLGEDTLRRMRATGRGDCAPLLWRRAVAIAPDCEALHRAILAFLVEQKAELELLRYVNQLSHASAPWLSEYEEM